MRLLKGNFSTVWFTVFSILLTLGLLVLLGFWHSTELKRGAEDYRRTMDELSYLWYERFNLPFLALEELFATPEGLGSEEEVSLIVQRWQFWTQHSDYPSLFREILRIRSGAEPIQVLPIHGEPPGSSAVWTPLVDRLAAPFPAGAPANQGHTLILIDSTPYLVLNVQGSTYVLVLDQGVFYSQFAQQITGQVLPKMRAALPGFSPAILHMKDKPQVYYCPDRAPVLGKMYLMYSLDDQFDPSVLPLDGGLNAGLQRLQLETSYFLKMWLAEAPSNDSGSAPSLETSAHASSQPQGVHFAFLPQQGDIETVVFWKSFPLFALGYSALALMGLSLLTASRYNHKILQLLIRQEEFVASMTHELRTPLHVITNGASNLSDGIVSQREDIARYGKLLHSQATRLSDMIESILNFAGITNRPPVCHEIDLPELFEEVVAPYRLICREQQIQIEEEFRGQPQCNGDPQALRLIVSNLLSNAIKHAGSGKWIRVSMVAEGGVTIEVQDQGPGISRRELPQVTDPFFRGGRGKDRVQGNGLGLSIVKRIADAENGSLEITSEEGKGCRFLVKLPYPIGETIPHV